MDSSTTTTSPTSGSRRAARGDFRAVTEAIAAQFPAVAAAIATDDPTVLRQTVESLPVVSSVSDEPVVMYLRKQGPGAVTAADIAPPAGVEVHNPTSTSPR